jgi:hypothetical protein
MDCQLPSDPIVRLRPRDPGAAFATGIDPGIRLRPGTATVPSRSERTGSASEIQYAFSSNEHQRAVLRAMRRSVPECRRLEVLPELRVTKGLGTISAAIPILFLVVFTASSPVEKVTGVPVVS